MQILSKNNLFLKIKEDILDYEQDNKVIAKTMIKPLDDITTLSEGTLTLIGGRSGSGKTRFISYLLGSFIKQGINTLYITIEGGAKNFGLKYVEIMTEDVYSMRNIKNGRISTSNYMHKIDDMNKEFLNDRACAGFVFDKGITLEKLENTLKTDAKDYKAIIIDYVQGIQTDKLGIYEQNKYIAESLARFAVEHNKIILGIAQLNRQADNTLADNAPSVANIAGSGYYEQAADTIILIKRKMKKSDNYYIPTNDVELYVSKNRPDGYIKRINLNTHYREIEKEKTQEWYAQGD